MSKPEKKKSFNMYDCMKSSKECVIPEPSPASDMCRKGRDSECLKQKPEEFPPDCNIVEHCKTDVCKNYDKYKTVPGLPTDMVPPFPPLPDTCTYLAATATYTHSGAYFEFCEKDEKALTEKIQGHSTVGGCSSKVKKGEQKKATTICEPCTSTNKPECLDRRVQERGPGMAIGSKDTECTKLMDKRRK